MIEFHVTIESKNGNMVLSQTFNNTCNTSIITNEIFNVEEMCQRFNWTQSRLSENIGKTLFTILNKGSMLDNALKEAEAHGELLHLSIRTENVNPDLPFELLYKSDFLAPFRVHVIRHITDDGHKRKVEPLNRPLKILFMASSPEGVEPILDFEKEEETILEVTRNLPVDITVEDTGSLQGLKESLEQHVYDIIHVSGHANIEGTPYFCMEDEEGYLEKVTPPVLQNILDESLQRPRLIFLSGCRTGEAFDSFAQQLVMNYSPPVVGWGKPVSDPGATKAAAQVYYELSRGKSIIDAVFSARQKLYKEGFPDWCLLRLFSDGTPLDIPVVEQGQKRTVKARDIQYTYLLNSKMKVLTKGFVGRRRQIQKGISTLKKGSNVGLLLYGTGGLGKSCLAGKFCDRFSDHALIVVHGKLNDFTLKEAVKNAFYRTGDEKGLKTLEEEDFSLVMRKLCYTSFLENRYLIVMDDFEKNLEGYQQGNPVVTFDAAVNLEVLLQYLPYACKMTQLIITSRYTFPLSVNGRDLVKERLELIGLTSFQGADERKKITELKHIDEYPDSEVRKKLIEAGRGNPRLMEILNSLILAEKDLNANALLEMVEGKQEELVQELVLREILRNQPQDFQKVMRLFAVFGLPVVREGLYLVCNELEGVDSYVDTGVQLSLVEKDTSREEPLYWVTPLLREEIFGELDEKERKTCHKAAVAYYRTVFSLMKGYNAEYAFHLTEHALLCGMQEIALEEGRKLLSYLRNTILFEDALNEGRYILSQISKPMRNDSFSKFSFELGWIYYDVRDLREAITHFKQALRVDIEINGNRHPSVARDLGGLGMVWKALGKNRKAIVYFERAIRIDGEVYGENHPHVAASLNNLGSAWKNLGDPKKAIEYYERALRIDGEVYGENHPDVARDLNNLGRTWDILGDHRKAIDYYEKALSIDRELFGENHPDVATVLNNLGAAWGSLKDFSKAIEYQERALNIYKKAYGEKHPNTAAGLGNLGLALCDSGEPRKALEFLKRALFIYQEVYGERHPNVAKVFSNLGFAWRTLGDIKKAIEYYERALRISRVVQEKNHPDVARDLNNLGEAWRALGDSKKAFEHFQQAYTIFQEAYGDQHPRTRTAKESLDDLGNYS
ncbi:MAG: tetratricopeptide repeat protein [Theionarchaea archaeon]|nr:tetratricopeptide repeat protein [Theionarchaea archaeon]